ncbi:MAG: hypothetical protein ACHQ52_02650 [Candidatus Eisenbacteria bacterium]
MNPRRVTVALALSVAVAGCAAGTGPHVHSTSPSSGTEEAIPAPPKPSGDTGFTRIVAGAGLDTVSAVPGTPGAAYRIRFKQTVPASSGFTYYDRDLSFYFRPSPYVLQFQVQNKQNKPVWIDWDRSVFYTPSGVTSKVASSSTRYDQRFSTQAMTQIAGLQTYSDYVLPMTSLVDPTGSGQQLHRMLLPEDEQAMQFTGRDFGVDLVIMVDDKPVTYPFRFQVVSVLKNP